MRLPSKTRAFAILMLASALTAFLLPASWTNWLRLPFQVLGLVQWPVTSAARDLAGPPEAPPPVSRAPLEGDAADVERLRARVLELESRTADLEQALATSTGIAGQQPNPHVRLVLAPVVGYDASPGRRTLQITLDERSGPLVQSGQWVAAGLYETPSAERLAARWLIGRVGRVQTRLATVVLASDPSFSAVVYAARLGPEGDLRPAEEECLLKGRGGRRMLISQASRDYVASGETLVMIPAGRGLPLPLVLGRIEGSAPNPRSALHFELEVAPWGAVESLTHVWVIAAK